MCFYTAGPSIQVFQQLPSSISIILLKTPHVKMKLLEKTLREIRPELDQIIQPNEIRYADDVDFVSTKKLFRS